MPNDNVIQFPKSDETWTADPNAPCNPPLIDGIGPGTPAVQDAFPFGYALSEMDLESFFSIRKWLQEACEARGAVMVGAGIGCGQADIDIEMDGCCYNISIRPLPKR